MQGHLGGVAFAALCPKLGGKRIFDLNANEWKCRYSSVMFRNIFSRSLPSWPSFAKCKVLLGLALVAIPLTASPVQAQDEVAENEEEGSLICVAIGIRWSGTAAERQEIRTTPVPTSFLSILNGGDCSSWQLMKTSLIDWHLRHGDEQSALAAVRFLENEFQGNLGPNFADSFVSAWQQAVADGQMLLDRQRVSEEDLTGASWHSAIEPELMRLGSVSELRELAARLESAEFVAGEYTRSADALLSRALLEEAQRIHKPLSAITHFIDEREALGGLEAVLARRFQPDFRTDRLSTSVRDITLAVTEALLIRDEATIRKAHDVTQQYFNPGGETFPMPDLHTFLDFAYEGDDEACIPDERNSREGYEERCEDDNLEHFALIFWYQRARLELLAREEGVALETMRARLRPRDHTRSVVDLFIRRAWHEGGRYNEETYPAEAVRLLVGLAKAEASTLHTPCRAARSELGREDSRKLYRSLAAISHALALASPSVQPQLYREVAMARLELQRVYEACGADIWEPQYERELLLANAFLAQYDELMGVE